MPKKTGKPPTGTRVSTHVLKDAQELLQRAERKRGLQAISACEAAVARFREVVNPASSLQMSAEDCSSAQYGLATALQYSAECLLSCSKSCNDEEVRQAEEAARATAGQLLLESVSVYQKVTKGDGSIQTDALVDCGNALTQLAEISESSAIEGLLQDAIKAYMAALNFSREASVYVNMADTIVSLAEQQCAGGELATAKQSYSRAMGVYGTACSMSSSDAGDDLPGLLHNWGVSLYSMGTHMQDETALQEAAAKLRAARDFERGDAMVLNALGDTLVALAETQIEAEAQVQALQQALEEGYQSALRIDRHQTDALVGCAEIELQLGRACPASEGKSHFQESMKYYRSALQQPTRLGGFKDRCDVRYNYACAACLCGHTQAAEAVLDGLLAVRATSLEDIRRDNDLQHLHESDWLKQNVLHQENDSKSTRI